MVGIGGEVVADPAPVLRQIILNQLGYAQTTVTGLGATASEFLAFLTQDVPTAVQQAAAQIAQGDIVGAADTLNGLALPLLLAVSPLLPILSIPGQIADNLSNAVNALTGPDAVQGLLLGVLTPVEAIISAAGASGQAFVDALGAGDPIEALTAVINVPAVLTGALLNGFANDMGTYFPGLLTFDPVPINGGLVQTLLVTLPRLVAAAIAPEPPMTASLTKTTADIASIPDVTATTLRLDTQSKDSGVDTLKPGADPDSGTPTATNVDVDPAANGTDGTDETDETDADDGQATATTNVDTSNAPDVTKDGNKTEPREVNTGVTGQNTPKAAPKSFDGQVKSFLGKLGFKPHGGQKTGTDPGTPATAPGNSGTTDPGSNGSGAGGSGLGSSGSNGAASSGSGGE